MEHSCRAGTNTRVGTVIFFLIRSKTWIMKILIDIPTQMGKPYKLPLLDEELYRTDGCQEKKNQFSPGICP